MIQNTSPTLSTRPPYMVQQVRFTLDIQLPLKCAIFENYVFCVKWCLCHLVFNPGTVGKEQWLHVWSMLWYCCDRSHWLVWCHAGFHDNTCNLVIPCFAGHRIQLLKHLCKRLAGTIKDHLRANACSIYSLCGHKELIIFIGYAYLSWWSNAYI